jgi:hypothetical protein
VTDKIRDPKVKAGDVVKDYSGIEYKVLIVSNEYNEVEKYDSTGMYLDIKTDEQLEDDGVDPADFLYCAVQRDSRTFVFPIMRDSRILGE